MKGYKRADGRIGIRNHIAIMYTVECARHVAERIAQAVPGAEVFGFSGCYEDAYAYRMLVELGAHPNVAGVVIVRLGCESTDVDRLAAEIGARGKRVERIHIQHDGGTLASIEAGIQAAAQLAEEASRFDPVEIQWSDLIIGVECGGSDATSGLSANPATGWAVDRLIERGSTVIFSELPELIGCESFLHDRAANDRVRRQLSDGMQRARKLGNLMSVFAVSAGNEEGGLTTIEEKSMGALCKAGSKPIDGVLLTAEKPQSAGLYVLDKVGLLDTNRMTIYEENDNDGLITLIASGAHLILFTTGRGSVVGSVVSPVVKICGNPETCRRMPDDFDIDAGGIITGAASIQTTGEKLLSVIEATAAGLQTRSEQLGHKEYHIPYKPGRACDVLAR